MWQCGMFHICGDWITMLFNHGGLYTIFELLLTRYYKAMHVRRPIQARRVWEVRTYMLTTFKIKVIITSLLQQFSKYDPCRTKSFVLSSRNGMTNKAQRRVEGTNNWFYEEPKILVIVGEDLVFKPPPLSTTSKTSQKVFNNMEDE